MDRGEPSNHAPDVGEDGLAARKKKRRAAERDELARADWVDRALTLPARRVVVIDESSTHLDMGNAYARAERGQRAYASGASQLWQKHNFTGWLALDRHVRTVCH